MDTPLNASASSAGGLISGSIFEVPPYQREYSWTKDQVGDFFQDIHRSLEEDSYFLGLIILTDENGRKQIVDGQQRVVTLTLLAAALHYQAVKWSRSALADRLKANFLTSINYETDESDPRVVLTDVVDNETLQAIVSLGDAALQDPAWRRASNEIVESYEYLSSELAQDLKSDPFKRLGKWTDFITNKLYFAVFIHPDPESAYQVFEVINTRGKDLTTAHLLKNYLISQVPPAEKQTVYQRWKRISDNFPNEGANNFVQYIRHIVTVTSGYVLPKDLFSFLAARKRGSDRTAMPPMALIQMLEERLPLYLQIIDPSLPGPATEQALGIFQALKRLNVLTVRPLVLAITETENPDEGLRQLLRLVVRRIVVGNLGTGNIERIFSEAAKQVYESKRWEEPLLGLQTLSPERDQFLKQLKTRSFNKGVIEFLKNSIAAGSVTPNSYQYIHYIAPKAVRENFNISDGDLAYWGNTIGNTFLSNQEKRIAGSDTWLSFKSNMLPTHSLGELIETLESLDDWTAKEIQEVAEELADKAARIWYD